MKEKRTKWLALALAGTLLLGLLSACGETEETSADIELDDTVSGETLTAGDQADRVFSLAVDYNQTLNPITTRSQLNQMVGDLVYDRLFDVDENFHVSSRILSARYCISPRHFFSEAILSSMGSSFQNQTLRSPAW